MSLVPIVTFGKLCREKISFKPYQNEHNWVKEAGENGKKCVQLTQKFQWKSFSNIPLYFLLSNATILKAFPETLPELNSESVVLNLEQKVIICSTYKSVLDRFWLLRARPWPENGSNRFRRRFSVKFLGANGLTAKFLDFFLLIKCLVTSQNLH